MLGTDVMTTAELLKQLGVHRTTLERWVKEGEFPAPTRIGGRLYWLRSEVQDWIDGRFADTERDSSRERA
jgi:excisionase family DNA binding protein